MVKLKTPELLKAKRAVLKFLRDNNLSPFKDYTNHPKYGKEFKELVLRLNIERDKVLTKYPQTDNNFKKYQKMKKNKKDKKDAVKADVQAKAQKLAAAKEKAEVKTSKKKKEAKENKAVPKAIQKYDYPLIDGREMTAIEKKKYRAEQRKLAKGGDSKPAKEKKAKKEAPEVKAKKEKVVKEKKVEKKKKKAKKEED